MNLNLDHLVVAARTLDEGVQWCEQTLGITPGPGGSHPLMGTHNRLFSIASAEFPRAYFEIIAIDPQAAPPGRRRWFDLDDPALQAALQDGPQWIHWVARCTDIDARLATLRGLGIDAGEALQAERQTARGPLRWTIAVRADGRRLHGGAWPTLIEWGEVHPADTMPDSGVSLQSFEIDGLPEALAGCLPAPMTSRVRRGSGVASAAPAVDPARQARPSMRVTLRTPRGPVTLHCPAPENNDVQP